MLERTLDIIHIFFCYAREDKELLNKLEVHLSSLKRQKLISTWYDREITPGSEWKSEIDSHLNTAQIVLLLVSPHFINSDYCYGIEMQKALENHKTGTSRVIPIILRPVYWKGAPFSHLQVLPSNALPLTSWQDQDAALVEITEYIHKVAEELLTFSKTKEEWLDEGDNFYKFSRFEEALIASERAIRIDPNNASAHLLNGFVLHELKRYEESLAALYKVVRNNPHIEIVHEMISKDLRGLLRYEEALTASNQAIRLNPKYTEAYIGKGFALNELGRYEEAVAAFNQAIHLDPNQVLAFRKKGFILDGLGRYEEAIAAFDQAIRLDPNFALIYGGKGLALAKLQRYREALAAFDQAIRLDPNDVVTYRNKAITLGRLGMTAEAQQAQTRANQLESRNKLMGY